MNSSFEDDFAWVVEGLLLIIIGAFGLFGNGSAIIIFSRQRIQRVFHHLLLLLAIFDTVSALGY